MAGLDAHSVVDSMTIEFTPDSQRYDLVFGAHPDPVRRGSCRSNDR